MLKNLPAQFQFIQCNVCCKTFSKSINSVSAGRCCSSTDTPSPLRRALWRSPSDLWGSRGAGSTQPRRVTSPTPTPSRTADNVSGTVSRAGVQRESPVAEGISVSSKGQERLVLDPWLPFPNQFSQDGWCHLEAPNLQLHAALQSFPKMLTSDCFLSGLQAPWLG